MNKKLFDALQDCLSALEQGEGFEDVLARYPELDTELRPVLEVAELSREAASFGVPSEAIQRSRARLLGHAARLRQKPQTKRLFGLPRAASVALTAGFVILISAGGLLTVSAQALPGDTLYSMKRAVETVSLRLTSKGEAKRSLLAEYNQRRIDETVVLLKLGRAEIVTFEGVVNEKTADFWVVDEIRTQVVPNTNVVGQIEVGMGVEVTGEVRSGDWIEAITIKLRTYQLYGTLQQVRDDKWVVEGISLDVDELTLIDDGIEVGDDVLALLRVDDAGEVTALAILKADDESGSQGEDSPSATKESPTEEDEVETDGTEEDESETPESTQESDEPEDTGTPEPDETDEHDDTPKPDKTDEPDETDEPRDTPDSETTPEPTNTPDD